MTRDESTPLTAEDESWRDPGIGEALRNGYNLNSYQRERILDRLAIEAEARSQREPELEALRAIQRYTLTTDVDGSGYLELDPEGRWCLFEDVEP